MSDCRDHHGTEGDQMDQVTIEIDTLVVRLNASDATAVAEGRLDALGTAVVAALRNDPAVAGFLPASVMITTAHGGRH